MQIRLSPTKAFSAIMGYQTSQWGRRGADGGGAAARRFTFICFPESCVGDTELGAVHAEDYDLVR